MSNSFGNVDATGYNRDRDHNIRVVDVALVGSPHSNSRWRNSALHWRIFLLLSVPRRSVILDMRPVDGTSQGTLYITSRDYQLTNNRLGVFQAEATASFSVGTLINTLLDRGFAKYRYNENGAGCRYWCETVLRDMASQHLVGDSRPRAFQRFIEENHDGEPVLFPLPTTMGSFS